jgi:hypothetical protein
LRTSQKIYSFYFVLDTDVKRYLLKVRNKLRVLEEKVLRRLCGCTKLIEDGGFKNLLNDELHTLYSSSVLQVVKNKCIGWAGYVARMGKRIFTYINLVGKF